MRYPVYCCQDGLLLQLLRRWVTIIVLFLMQPRDHNSLWIRPSKHRSNIYGHICPADTDKITSHQEPVFGNEITAMKSKQGQHQINNLQDFISPRVPNIIILLDQNDCVLIQNITLWQTIFEKIRWITLLIPKKEK